MSATLTSHEVDIHPVDPEIQRTINSTIETLMGSLPNPKSLSAEEGRGIIARYSAILEGNFIYWMTATLLAVQAEGAKPIILDNLYEEVRDAHPAMLRRFALEAHALPTDQDALAVHEGMTNVRLFLGRLSAVQSLATMAFFEGFIQRFMPFLAELAAAQGSTDMEYTDVHGVCDIAHTAGLFQALSTEMDVNPLEPGKDLYEGVNLLSQLMETVVFNQPVLHAA
jgi:Iron-containing redox enzyme